MKTLMSKNPVLGLVSVIGIVALVALGVGKLTIASSSEISSDDSRPPEQIAFMNKMEEFEKQFQDADYNEARQDQIEKEAVAYGETITHVKEWVSPVVQVSNGNIKVVMMTLYPGHIESYADLQNGELVKYSGDFKVGSVTNMFGKWAVYPEVTYCQVQRLKK